MGGKSSGILLMAYRKALRSAFLDNGAIAVEELLRRAEGRLVKFL